VQRPPRRAAWRASSRLRSAGHFCKMEMMELQVVLSGLKWETTPFLLSENTISGETFKFRERDRWVKEIKEWNIIFGAECVVRRACIGTMPLPASNDKWRAFAASGSQQTQNRGRILETTRETWRFLYEMSSLFFTRCDRMVWQQNVIIITFQYDGPSFRPCTSRWWVYWWFGGILPPQHFCLFPKGYVNVEGIFFLIMICFFVITSLVLWKIFILQATV
jgi:hypothetical protein